MYLGKIIESAETSQLLDKPMHPYTQALLSSILVPDPESKNRRISLKGEVPTPINPPEGCRFHTRCPYRMDICDKVVPTLEDYGREHFVACHMINNK